MPTEEQRLDIPADKNGRPLYNVTPRALALARTIDNAINKSKPINLNNDTTFLRVYAISKDVLLKWASNDTDYCKVDNFDEIIPASQYVDFAVAYKADGTLYSKIQVVGRENGGTVVIIEK